MKPKNKKNNNFSYKVYILLAWVALIVYLFVSAPPPLPETTPGTEGKRISSFQLFELVQQENAIVRKIWTKEIVGAGKKQGLKFDEDWKDKEVKAGPLPALFLRATASGLEANPIPLSLFLGSDAPINQANEFDPEQNKRFQEIKKTRLPQFFYSEDIARYTGMFPDIAAVKPCVTCHNDHKESPKDDWELLDVMGATTWLYPDEYLSLEEAIGVIEVLRTQFKSVYESYLEKTEAFSSPPEVGKKWPREGYYLPSAEVFMSAFEQEASSKTMRSLFNILKKDE